MIPCPYLNYFACHYGRFPQGGTGCFLRIPRILLWMRARHLAATTTRTVQHHRAWRWNQVSYSFCMPDASFLNSEGFCFLRRLLDIRSELPVACRWLSACLPFCLVLVVLTLNHRVRQFTGQANVPQQLSTEPTCPDKQPRPRTQDVASDEGEEACVAAGLRDHSHGSSSGNNSEDNSYQVQYSV